MWMHDCVFVCVVFLSFKPRSQFLSEKITTKIVFTGLNYRQDIDCEETGSFK